MLSTKKTVVWYTYAGPQFCSISHFSIYASLFPIPVFTPYVCYNSPCHSLSAPSECTACLPRGLQSMSDRFFRSVWCMFKTLEYFENGTLVWCSTESDCDSHNSVLILHMMFCFSVVWVLYGRKLNVFPLLWYWADKNSGLWFSLIALPAGETTTLLTPNKMYHSVRQPNNRDPFQACNEEIILKGW